ncbi:MAG: tetratricopeptide repeat protein, partial [Anaerolineae bacterium]
QLGLVAQTEQDYGEAKYLFQESHAIYAELQEPWSTTRVLNNLGYTLYALKDYTKARAVFGESLAMAAAAQLLPVALEALVGLVNLRINEGTAEQALAWLTYALRHPAIGKQTKDRAEQLCLVLEAQLTQPQIAAAQAQTQTKTFDAVVQEVLSNHNS